MQFSKPNVYCKVINSILTSSKAKRPTFSKLH